MNQIVTIKRVLRWYLLLLCAISTCKSESSQFFADTYKYILNHAGQTQQSAGTTCTLEKQWKRFHRSEQATHKHVALCASLRISSKQAQKLTSLSLIWEPGDLWPDTPALSEQLSATLYSGLKHQPFAPLEENYLATGLWKKQASMITWQFTKKIVGNSRFYVVISYPPALENYVQSGRLRYDDQHSITSEPVEERNA